MDTTIKEISLIINKPTPAEGYNFLNEIEYIEANEQHINKCISIYSCVAQKWNWRGKLNWKAENWKEHLVNTNILFYLVKNHSQYIGFFELNLIDKNKIAIKYMTLLDDYIGKGYGKDMINKIKMLANMRHAPELLVKTRSSDHPNALKNYIKAGFIITGEESIVLDE